MRTRGVGTAVVVATVGAWTVAFCAYRRIQARRVQVVKLYATISTSSHDGR